MIWALLTVFVFVLAYSNGANDNFNGVATLYGSKTAPYKKALIWATVTTIAGSLVSLIFAQALVKTFSGKGIIPDELLGTPELLLPVSAGTAITILIATFIGMPTSTTHALTGSLTGIAFLTSIDGIPYHALTQNFLGPLIASPILAIVVSIGVYTMFHQFRKRLGVTSNTCICLKEGDVIPVHVQTDGTMYLQSSGKAIVMDEVKHCIQSYDGRLLKIDAQKPVDMMHYLSSGAVCFSRAVNDTPKIAALMLAAPVAFSSHFIFGMVAIAMAVGGWLNAKKVAETMSYRITDFSTGQGLSANLSTAALVLFASKLGMPVSTTHVSCGTLFGIAAINRKAKWGTIAQILTVWFTTFPFAAAVAATIYYCIS